MIESMFSRSVLVSYTGSFFSLGCHLRIDEKSPFWGFFFGLNESKPTDVRVGLLIFSYSIFQPNTILKARFISSGFSFCNASLSICWISIFE